MGKMKTRKASIETIIKAVLDETQLSREYFIYKFMNTADLCDLNTILLPHGWDEITLYEKMKQHGY